VCVEGWSAIAWWSGLTFEEHADVNIQAGFNNDVKQAAASALTTTKLGEGWNPLDKNNPWAFFDHYH
jgi:DMSO/TMAO reductase YedYZ molybdopterin-dependent catalytic subunit